LPERPVRTPPHVAKAALIPGLATSTVLCEKPAGSDATAGSIPLESAPPAPCVVAAFTKFDAAERTKVFAWSSKKKNGLSAVSVLKVGGENFVSPYVRW
jgi:hypothetical protein